MSAGKSDSSLASRVMLAAVAAITLLAFGLAWFVVYKDREALLADRGVTLANRIERNLGLMNGGITKRLQEIFSAFAGARGANFQLRYIGVAGNGRELVRVDVRDSRPVSTPREGLQEKGDRNYFQAALKLKLGEVREALAHLCRQGDETAA